MKKLHIERKVKARIPTNEGEFELHLYHNSQDDKEHLALVHGDVKNKSQVLVRVHSECFTGDVLGSQRCDCGEQLHYSMQKISKAGKGILIYMRQEGRGIGLLDKLRAYNLQDEGYDTVDANLLLGHQEDEREYSIAACILRDLAVRSVQILTNNPGKIKHLRQLGIKVTSRVPVEPTINNENAGYLFTKAQRMNHILNLDLISSAVQRAGHGST